MFRIFYGLNMMKTSGTNFRTGDFAPPEPKLNEFWTPEFGPEFSGRIFPFLFCPAKDAPEEFTLEKFTSQNSPSQNSTQKSGKEIHIGHLAEKIGMTGFVRDGFGCI